MTSRNWCVTVNNPTVEDYSCFAQDHEVFKYWAYADEVGDEGTPHIQGFISLMSPKRITGVKKLFPRAHLEAMRGNFGANEKYCSKEGSLIEFGDKPDPAAGGKAEKRRWDDILQAAKEGRIDDIDPDVQLRYYSTIKRIALDYAPKLDKLPFDEKVGIWIYGKTGTGKSRAVSEAYPDAYVTMVDDKSGFPFDGYKGQDVVLIEDLDPFQVKWSGMLKRLVDIYPIRVPVKGASLMIRPKRVIVTSNFRIKDIWEDYTTQDCLLRRFIEIEKIINKDIDF